MSRLDPPLRPKFGTVLNVLLIARVSDPAPGKQDERSLDDQDALYHEWLNRNYEGVYNATPIAGKGSGEWLDRKESADAIAAVESGRFDLVLTEDLGRVFRRVDAYQFCELCEDHRTRCIALNDMGVDTGHEDWPMAAFFAVMRHEAYNRDTAKRIRRTHRHRFSQGGVVQWLPPGYIKPRPHANDSECSKDPAAEAVYDEWFRRLEEGQSYACVADWLNAIPFPVPKSKPGKSRRNSKWDGRMVKRITFNTVLKGLRQRNRQKSVRVNRTGRHRSVPAPAEDLLQRYCPHLAFIEEARYDRLICQLTERNGHYRRRGENGRDPRANVSKKRTRWPGQHLYCGICGRMFVFGGHGQTDHLMCNGAREYRCWNGTTVDGPLAVQKLSPVVMAAIEDWPDYDEDLRERVRAELDEDGRRQSEELAALQDRRRRLEREERNVMEALRAQGTSTLLAAEIQRIEHERLELDVAEYALNARQAPIVELPPVDELKQRARQRIEPLAVGSPEFGVVMQRLIPRIEVFPYRLLDDGPPVLRAAFTLDLSAMMSAVGTDRPVISALQQRFVVDLFDPPQREAFRKRVVELSSVLTQLQVAARLGITTTAAQRAAQLQRRMDELGLTDPYLPLREPFNGDKKHSRHRHARYRFEPLPGCESPVFPTD